MTTTQLRSRNVRLLGYDELKRKLKYDVLVQPEMDDALNTFTRRVIDRPGKGLGSQRNALSESRLALGMTVKSSLIRPRITGRAWGRKNTNIIIGMSSRVMAAAIRRIEARWGE